MLGPRNVQRRTLRHRREGPAHRRDWFEGARSHLLKELASAASSVRVDRNLILALLEELGADDAFIELLGEPAKISKSKYGQALAVALLLRHSWRPDDLEQCAEKLRLVRHFRAPAESRTQRRPRPADDAPS